MAPIISRSVATEKTQGVLIDDGDSEESVQRPRKRK